ncbi:hypothetical protein Bca101_046962 [Brassica carinata]
MIRFYDMRLDIDNMSYEELLALGDKMGTVSTALSEEALINESTGLSKYVDGDEVGSMPCEHMFHVSCVQQWLRMKNWCPYLQNLRRREVVVVTVPHSTLSFVRWFQDDQIRCFFFFFTKYLSDSTSSCSLSLFFCT